MSLLLCPGRNNCGLVEVLPDWIENDWREYTCPICYCLIGVKDEDGDWIDVFGTE